VTNYYGYGQPSKMSKWLGFGLGAIFAVIAVGCGWLIFKMTRSPIVATASVATAPAAQPSVAPTATAPAPAPAAKPVALAAPQTPAPQEAAAAESAPTPHRHHSSSRHHHHSSKVASAGKAKPSKPMSSEKSNAILAKHDSKEKRKQKDDLDKLLGL
jgi:type IV secretory pathway VirB10-like protein